ncbi:MAG: signal peptidase I [Clostridia bacterium]|nr:signal peptidase I [Clostridia bacterium]
MSPKVKNIIEWCYCFVIAVVLAIVVRYFVGTPTIVKQVSMKPTLIENDRLILNRLAVTFNHKWKRGEIITFEAPSDSNVRLENADLSNPIAKYDNNPDSLIEKFSYYVLEIGKMSYIKRVIGLPGEHVQIKDGKVFINGKELEEKYLNGIETGDMNGIFTDVIVPEGTLFVMGDNRPHSTDSRCFGCIPFAKIEGKVALRFWPLNKFGKIK